MPPRRPQATDRTVGTCAYCARSGVRSETEHVFPESWYPDGFPRSAMLVVPACRPCNGNYGRIEERMFLPLVGGLPGDRATASLIGRALRGVDPTQGRSVRDTSHRAARPRSIQARLGVLTSESREQMVWTPEQPGPQRLCTPAGLHVQGIPTVAFEPHDLESLAIKFLKGCYYAHKRVPLRVDAVCDARTFSQDPINALTQAERSLHLNYGGQPPFRYAFARSIECDTTSLWFFVLWNHYVLAASAVSPEHSGIESSLSNTL